MATQTLGTLLRTLSEHVDSAVEQFYSRAGLTYKARFTPIFRVLLANGPSTIRQISIAAGISHSAASQTLSQMVKSGLVQSTIGHDARQRIISLTPAAFEIVPQLERQWRATDIAVQSLNSDLGMSLPNLLATAIQILEERHFVDRIEDAFRSDSQQGTKLSE